VALSYQVPEDLPFPSSITETDNNIDLSGSAVSGSGLTIPLDINSKICGRVYLLAELNPHIQQMSMNLNPYSEITGMDLSLHMQILRMNMHPHVQKIEVDLNPHVEIMDVNSMNDVGTGEVIIVCPESKIFTCTCSVCLLCLA